MSVGGLVLAAGGGTRLGLPKALLVVRGESLVAHAVGVLSDGGCQPVVVVLGARAAEVEVPAGAEAVCNSEWERGIGSSLRIGLDALDGRCEAAAVILVDQPGLIPEAVRRVVAAWRDGARAVVATYGGTPGHPVLLDRTLWQDATVAASEDGGARTFLRTHPELVTEVRCDGAGDPADIDTRADLERFLARKAQ